MPRSQEEQRLTSEFTKDYRLGQTETMLAIERAVCGCDYGGTSWTTRSEADRIGRLLALEPGKRLLDVGAGSGWPGLYVARNTGCDLALVDLPFEGIRIAAERAAADQLSGACWVAVSDGADLPFRDGGFDAISHSDVLCCLDAKRSVLTSCRRVIRPGGRMVFTVLFIPSGLSERDHARALELAPAFVAAEVAYPDMLRQTGWEITERSDLSPDFARSVRRLIREEEARADELTGLLGEAELTRRLTRARAKAEAIEAGLVRRGLFAATTADRAARA